MPKVFLVRRNAGKTNCYREPCDVRRESIYPLNTYSYFISQLENKSYDYVDPDSGFDENGKKVDISHRYGDVNLKSDENNNSVYPKSFRAMPSAISQFPSQNAVFSTTNEQSKIKTISNSSQKPFACSICGKSFRLSSTLCRHKIIHTSERPHKCYICFKSFNRSSTLKTHLRTHNQTKEFVCRTCGKGFHQKGNLRNHSLIHTGEKPYSCKVCGKAFNKLSNLKFHMHIHTDQKPYRCRVCKLSMTRRGELKLHIRTCHPESV